MCVCLCVRVCVCEGVIVYLCMYVYVCVSLCVFMCLYVGGYKCMHHLFDIRYYSVSRFILLH